MHPDTIRKIDSWFGKPCCAILTLLRKMGRVMGRQQESGAPLQKILLVKLIEQGATVLAYPAMCRAIEMVGREHVYFWVFEENRPIVDLLDIIPPENIFSVRSGRLCTFLLDTMRILQKVRQLKVDATVDMEFFARASAILAFQSGARMRVGLDRFTSEGPYRGDLMTHRVQYNPYIHVADAYYMMVEALTTSPDDIPLPKRMLPQVDRTPPKFEPLESDVERVQELLDQIAGRRVKRPIIVLNPNASDIVPLRRWPSERFVELARKIISSQPDVTLIITGSQSEERAAAGIERAIDSPRVLTVAGKTSLRDLLVLYSMSDILVTNDSGAGHFSSMTDIHSICLFGPETPALYKPLGKNIHVVWSGLACSPCVNVFNYRFSPCNDNVCMKSISVAQVFEIVRNLLSRGE